MANSSSQDIAIVGMAALFPQAKDLRAYWQNILNRVNAVTAAPDEWAQGFVDPDSTANNRIYSRMGGFLGPLAEFNPMEFGIMPNSVDGGEPDHFLALKVAWQALADAGYTTRPFNRQKTGIILGRGTYINRGYNTLLQHGQILDQTLALVRQLWPAMDADTEAELRSHLQASLPPFTAEMAPGLVPNVITGRIANRLDLMGPNYIVDAACASSLIAVEHALQELRSRRCDMMLVGGVHASTPPQINMIFCQLGALARHGVKPFQAGAEGTLLSEGVGMVVLKRLGDAEADGDRIYAVIKGAGTASDGKALGLLAPRSEGEVMALERAYESSGIDPTTLELIEAHGTGIPLGDRTEIHSLTQLMGGRQGSLPTCAVGSVKSMIGHCIPAAGAASLIKTALALYHKVLPPTLCDQVDPALELEKTPFYLNTAPRPWIHGQRGAPRRAGVNAFGFGGINAHLVLEEYVPAQATAPTLLHRDWPSEVLVFSGSDWAAVGEAIAQVQQYLEQQPEVSLADLAYTLSQRPLGSHRLALVASATHELTVKLAKALTSLTEPQDGRRATRSGIYTGVVDPARPAGATCFLFPGEGSQYPDMLSDLCLYFPQVRAWFDLLDSTFAERRTCPPSQLIFPPPTGLAAAEQELVQQQLYQMDVASEIVFIASMALCELLQSFRVPCDAMVGHSTGENTALIASGTIRLADRAELQEKMRQLNQIYLDLEVNGGIPQGALLTVGALEPQSLQPLLAEMEGRLYLAMDNCPNQVILFGNEATIVAVEHRLRSTGAICKRLPFNRAYHTPLFAPVAEAFGAFYQSLHLGPGQIPLYSCAAVAPFPETPDAIAALATQQWSSRVRFQETIQYLYAQGVSTFIEVGPSSNLSGFVGDILQGQAHLALASNSRRRPGLAQLMTLLARLSTQYDLDLAPLYRQRQLTELNLAVQTPALVASPVLTLTMPTMTLSPEFAQTLRARLGTPLGAVPKADAASTPPPLAAPAPLGTAPNLSTAPTAAPTMVPVTTLPATAPAAPPVPVGYREHQARHRQSELLGQYRQVSSVGLQAQPRLQLTPQDGGAPARPRTTNAGLGTILTDHFDLMNQFLSNQERLATRVQAQLAGLGPARQAGAPRAATAIDPAWPLLGQILEQSADRAYSERRFTLAQDPFLIDHTLGSQLSSHNPDLMPLPVIPFTVSMEMVAEAAVNLVGEGYTLVQLSDLRGYRWLCLDQGDLTLGILARRRPSPAAAPEVQVQIFQLMADQQLPRQLVFEGQVQFASEPLAEPPPLPFGLSQSAASRWADADLYRTGMFHGPRFQGVTHIRRWGPEGIEAELQTLATDDFFSDVAAPRLLTDAGLLDAAGQLVGYWVSEQFGTDFNVFPFQVSRFQSYGPILPPGTPVLCRGLMRFVSDRQTEASFDFLDANQRVIARLEGWQDRYFSIPRAYYQCRLHPQTAFLSSPWAIAEPLILRRIDPFPEGFFEDAWGIWLRVLAHLSLSAAERQRWYAFSATGKRRQEWLLGRIAAKDTVRQWAWQTFGLALAPVDISIVATTAGKPTIDCAPLAQVTALPDISISHSQGYTVAALAPPGTQIGVDLQRLTQIHADDLLVAAFDPSEQPWLQVGGAEAVVSLWCAKEAAAKALGHGLLGNPRQWQITFCSPDVQQVEVTYDAQTLQVSLRRQADEILAVCQRPVPR